MSLRLNEAIPKWEVVQTSRKSSTISATMEGVELYDQRQPVLTTGEREIARLVVVVGAAVTFRTNGDPANRGYDDIKMATAGNLIGSAVFTNRRVVGSVIRGDFFGNKLNIDRDGVGVLIEFPYEQVGALELEMKQKAFGGNKPIGIWMHARDPYGAGLRLDVQGSLALNGRSRRVDDLAELFSEVADAVALHSRPHVYPEAGALIDAYLSEGPTISEEGNPTVLLEPEGATEPMPPVSISSGPPPSADTSDGSREEASETPSTTEVVAKPASRADEDRVILARFCAKCGARFDDDSAFCSDCGTRRLSKAESG